MNALFVVVVFLPLTNTEWRIEFESFVLHLKLAIKSTER